MKTARFGGLSSLLSRRAFGPLYYFCLDRPAIGARLERTGQMSSDRATASRAAAKAVCAAFVIASVLYPRLILLGGFPATDEGVYAFFAQLIHANFAQGRGLLDFGTLQLYPLLLSWVFALDLNHLMLLRVVDMGFALLASWLLYRIMAEESASAVAGAVIAGIFLFAMNQPAFIQNGFKNSIFAAYVPLFAAARLALGPGGGSERRWWMIGSLTAIAVLLREPFVHFAAFGGLCILIAHGWRHCLRYVVGGLATALVVIGILAVWRGGMAALLASYLDLGRGYSSMADERWSYFVSALRVAWGAASYAVLLGLAGVATMVLRSRAAARWPRQHRWLFWVGVALTSLPEPLLKIGFPYHLAVSFVGLCGMAALGWRNLATLPARPRHALAGVMLAITAFLAWPGLTGLHRFFHDRTLPNLEAFEAASWPPNSVARSNYLLMAEAIKRVAEPGGTLSVSASMLVLFPLTGLLPPAPELNNLSETALDVNMDAARLREVVRQCPADVIMVTTRTDIPGRPVILEAVSAMPEYREVARVPVDGAKDYGHFGGSVYLRNAPHAACRLRP